MEKYQNNVIGPIDKDTWNRLSLYRSSRDYHRHLGNKDVLSMVEPMYNSMKESIKRS